MHVARLPMLSALALKLLAAGCQELPPGEGAPPGEPWANGAAEAAPQPPPAPLAAPSSSAPLVAAGLVAKEITSSSELIGGLRADGRLGDFLIANDKIRLIVQDIDHGAQFYIFGGNIIDADVVRASAEPGQDLLAEFFTDVDLTHTILPDMIQVISDGSDGQEARIRVTGADFPWPILPPKEPVKALPVRYTQDYVLKPGDRFVQIETSLELIGNRSVNVLQAELLLVGSSLRMAAHGLPAGELLGRTRFLSMMGSQTVGAAYLFAPESGSMTIPFEDAAQTGAILGGAKLRPGQTVSWRRHFFVGARDAASVTDAYYQARGEPTGRLEGLISAPDGTPIADASVVVVDAQGNYLSECLSDSSGRFAASLPGGDVTLRVSASGRSAWTSSPYAITPGRTTTATVPLSAAGRLRFRAVDASGAPSPVRATLVRSDGYRVQEFSAFGDRTIALEPGSYSATLTRGPEFTPVTASVTVPSTGALVTVPASAPAVLNRVLDTSGWLSGDFHLHQKNSNDSWTLLEDRVSSLLAEGVEVGVPTDHDHATDLRPTLEAMGLAGQLVTAVGNEVSVIDYGHFNYFPIQLDPNDSNPWQGSKFWFGDDLFPLSASELFYKMRQNPGEEVIQINHPRDGAMGYFSTIGYNSSTGKAIREPLAVDFDALEIKGEVFGDDSILPDYFSLLNQGLRIAAMGNSDAHRGKAENGYPRTYLRVADDRTQVTSFDQVVAALKGGHTTVSAGIFVNLEVLAGSQKGGPGDTLAPGSNPVSLKVRLQSLDSLNMQYLMVYANGIPLGMSGAGNSWAEAVEGATTIPLSPVKANGRSDQTLAISVRPVRDTYYMVLAWGDGNLGALSGHQVLGYTSPVYVDMDTAGFVSVGAGAPVGPVPAYPVGYAHTASCPDGAAHHD